MKEIKIQIPNDSRLIGVRTEGNVIIVSYEPAPKSVIVGFLNKNKIAETDVEIIIKTKNDAISK